MPSFIYSQRRNVDRLLALILLWNVVAGAFVTLGAPWLSEISGTTLMRPPAVLPTGFGWLAIGVPTHSAGIWLSVLGGYALYRARHKLQWHLAAVLFYAPQILAITTPLHVDMWVGLFAASSFPLPAGQPFAVNWIATTLLLAHAWLWLPDSKFRASLERTPAAVRRLSRDFWGSAPLSRTALARRFASIATIAAVPFLPLVPSDIFYPSGHTSELVQTRYFAAWFDKEDIMFWRRLLLLPMTFAAAYVVAFVWSGGRREPRFSELRGVAASLLTYVYLAMAANLLNRWLSDWQEPAFGLFILAWVYLLPVILLIPAIGGVTGTWLARNVVTPEESHQRRFSRLTMGMWLTLVTPLLAVLVYRLSS